jgi:hypothetical protein
MAIAFANYCRVWTVNFVVFTATFITNIFFSEYLDVSKNKGKLLIQII